MLNPRRRSLWWARGMYWSWLSSIVIIRWRCRPLASSVGVVIGVGVVRGCWRRLLVLSLVLVLSVGVGVVHWCCHWCWDCPLASLALSIGVVVVHWLVNGCECTWALMTVLGASGMGVVWCRLSSMVVLVGVGCVARGCRGCGCG